MSSIGARRRVRRGLGVGAVVAARRDPASPPRAARHRVPPGQGAAGTVPPEDGALGQETPAFLGLPAGIWERLGGPGTAGEGVKVGVIDTGIYPEHPSFADTPVGPDGRRYEGPSYAAPTGWKGVCQ